MHGYHCEVTFVFTSYQFRSEEFTKHLIKKNKLEILFKGLEMFRQEYKKSSLGFVSHVLLSIMMILGAD